jgi:hypothetical protein
MPTLSTNMRNTILDAALARLNGGSLVIGTTGMANTLSTHDLSATAFGSASNGSATANAIGDATIANSGTAAEASLQNSISGDEISEITVGLTGSGADITFDSVSFVVGGTVSVSSLTANVPANY